MGNKHQEGYAFDVRRSLPRRRQGSREEDQVRLSFVLVVSCIRMIIIVWSECGGTGVEGEQGVV